MAIESSVSSAVQAHSKIRSPGHFDLVSTTIRWALLLYLSPVILIVAAIGLTGIAFELATRILGRIAGFVRPRSRLVTLVQPSGLKPVIGMRPVTRVWGPERPRVTR